MTMPVAKIDNVIMISIKVNAWDENRNDRLRREEKLLPIVDVVLISIGIFAL